MTSTADKPRRRYAQGSREALLAAAVELFDARGYDGTTTRDIGERAGVEPALIARHFGSKEALYLAALERAEPAAAPRDLVEFLGHLLTRHQTRGVGPIGRAMVSPTLTDAAREQARDILAGR